MCRPIASFWHSPDGAALAAPAGCHAFRAYLPYVAKKILYAPDRRLRRSGAADRVVPRQTAGLSVNPVQIIRPRRFEDERGWFMETHSERAFAARGLTDHYVQDNHSLSRPAGVVRGLHFQVPPHAQAKLVRCVRGAIFDVAVDVRRGSPTYGQWVAARLTAAGGEQLYMPTGFAHGFITLEPDTEVCYKVTDFYAPAQDGGVIWNDPDIAVAWPDVGVAPSLSPKDLTLPRLADFDSPFPYDGRPLGPIEG
ncbi:MAG: dTDP-4-dehydrorhamnose 3,5-epimerase [Methylobacteriaceae bacterium]|nr:dTDP-4-dehydrorhamnose 3,5-epimerase [Methylobacteriaceae bacterium]